VKSTDLSPSESATLGFWLPVLIRAILKALGVGEASWNIIQANGIEAGQTVPHSHFHIVPRITGESRGVDDITDADRRNIALGQGPRIKLGDKEGREISEKIKVKLEEEIANLKVDGEIEHLSDFFGEEEELYAKIPGNGLKL